MQQQIEEKRPPITMTNVEKFKRDLMIGQSLFIAIDVALETDGAQKKKKAEKRMIVTIERKYPFIVQTDRGTFQYQELLLAAERYKGRQYE